MATEMTTEAQQPAKPLARQIYASILGVIGLFLLIGGAYLLALGGSPYYLFAGLAVTASAWFAWRGSHRGPLLYGAMLTVTLAWALWEAGIEGWALMPRLVAPAVLGLGFLLPPIRKGLAKYEGEPKAWEGWRGFATGLGGALILGLVAIISVVIVVG